MYKSLLLIVFALLLSSCASLIPSEHLIPQQQLAETVQKQFPLRWDKGGGLLSITIEVPTLTLISARNRLGLGGRFTAHVPLIDIEGDFACSGGLQYNPGQRAVYLRDISLDAFHLKQGRNLADVLRAEISRLMNSYAASHPVYRFKPDELEVLGVKVDVDGMGVVPEGVMLKLRTK